MPDFTVVTVGTDSSGRPIKMTHYMQEWWLETCEHLGFTPVIVQGAFMVGQGAAASAGYHDKGGCLDLRVWNLTEDQQGKVVRTLRRRGAAAWLRDKTHGGFDPHIHLVLGSDKPLADGAAWQWQEYVAGRDGLATRGKDYHWRPDPIVLTPPPPPRTPRWNTIWELAGAIAQDEEQELAARRVAQQIKDLAEDFSTKH